MKSDLENALLQSIRSGRSARDVVQSLLDEGKILSGKQAHRTLEKWAARGWYDYGVALDLGWLTDKAPEEIQTIPTVSPDPMPTNK